MGIYILSFLLIPVYKLFSNKKTITVFVALQLFCILAFRYEELGVDVSRYKFYYEYYGNLSFKRILTTSRFFISSDLIYGNESGYVWLNWICKNIFMLDFHGFEVIVAFICVISISTFIYKYSKDPAFSFCLFVGLGIYSYFFCILRQSLAMSILIWIVPCIANRKYIKSILILFLSILFHRTAIIFVLVIILSNYKIEKKTIPVVMFASVVITLIYPILNSVFFSKLLAFVGKDIYGSLSMSFNFMQIIFVFLYIVVYFLSKFKSENKMTLYNFSIETDSSINLIKDTAVIETTKENFIDNVIEWAFLLALPLQSIPMFTRVAQTYNLFFFTVLFPNLLQNKKDNNLRIFVQAITFLGLLSFYSYTLKVNPWEIVPYVSG
ncbi:MAG: EpsG family protein [Oscillospiraceae bacterium]|nr:EpsG family protein [Oscillospiraceae bacterium]